MSSWRDSASEEAQADLDGLLDLALPFAQEMLGKHGEFFPYAVALDEAGEARMVAGHDGDDDQPASAAVLGLLTEGLRHERDDLRAIALVADVRLTDSDAVRVELEHRDGHALARGLDYRELVAVAGDAHVWTG